MKTKVVSEPIVISPPASPTRSVPDDTIPREKSAEVNHMDTNAAEGEYMLIAIRYKLIFFSWRVSGC